MKNSFLLYIDQIEIFNSLADDQAGKLIKHIYDYNVSGNVPPEINDPVLAMAFTAIKMSMDRDIKKYESIVDRNRINGLRGGRPPSKPKKPTGLSGNPKNPSKPKKPKKADSDSDSDSDSDIGSEDQTHALSQFDIFWSIYPKKKNKETARKAWDDLLKDKEFPEIGVIVDAIKSQKETKDWKKENGRFIPYPATWLRAGAWQDETEPNSFDGIVSEVGQRTIENLKDLELT